MQSMLILHVVAVAQTCEESRARDIKKRLNSQYTVALRGNPLVFLSLVFNRIVSYIFMTSVHTILVKVIGTVSVS